MSKKRKSKLWKYVFRSKGKGRVRKGRWVLR